MYKFGIQVPQNVREALKIDKLLNSHLWQESLDRELASINHFGTVCALDEGPSLSVTDGCAAAHFMLLCLELAVLIFFARSRKQSAA